MNALIVGFGGMGCRHTQSLLASKRYEQISVVEPSDAMLEEGLQKINASPGDITRVPRIAQATGHADIVIIATSSEPRFEIMKQLLQRGFKHFLVEKIVFQSAAQFDEIIDLLEKSEARAYGNFVNRYFPTYVLLREKVRTSKARVAMTVTGGDLGIGCNAIHYLDLFEYLTGKNIQTVCSSLKSWDKVNKRGDRYREFSGLISAKSGSDDTLTVYFDPSHSGGAMLHLDLGQERFLLSEGSGVEYRIFPDTIATADFTIIATSKLSATIVDDILGARSPLTSVAQTRNAHVHLFKAVNKTLQLPDKDTTLCPIT